MNYIINNETEQFKIIMFEYDERNWEICFDVDKTEEQIQYLIHVRIDDLTDEYLVHGNYNQSDLFVDYCEKNNNI